MTSSPKEVLLKNLLEVQQLAQGSKLRRLFSNPSAYLYAIWVRHVSYRFTKATSHVIAPTFYGHQFNLSLPAATDIYLTKGKTHSSEIRLARFLIHHLDHGQTFVDVGAHFGYFTLLASRLVGETGEVHAFEASPTTFSILQLNVNDVSNISIRNEAMCDSPQLITFFQFPNLYSEYNSTDIEQYLDEPWYSQNKPEKIEIQGTTLDTYLKTISAADPCIKIDVEGAEYLVIRGGEELLASKNPTIIIEYLHQSRGNANHRKACQVLWDTGYYAHRITPDGGLSYIDNIDTYLDENDYDSDNIVFSKRKQS